MSFIQSEAEQKINDILILHVSIIRITLENLKMLYGADGTKERQFEKIDRVVDRIVHQIDEVLGFVRESPMNFQKESVQIF